MPEGEDVEILEEELYHFKAAYDEVKRFTLDNKVLNPSDVIAICEMIKYVALTKVMKNVDAEG